jgi:transcriptional regulator with XRE-family HTH domain
MEDMALEGTLHRVFAQNLRRLRLEGSLTQEEMAERLGIKQSQYSDLENARNSATLRTVERAAIALGVPYDDLLSAKKPDKAATSGA